MTMVTHGLLARLLAKPGQSDPTEQFLKGAVPQVQAEPGTLAWYALRFGRDDYGIFDAFGGDAARQAHLEGPVAQALQAQGTQLLQRDAEIARLDILASKLPAVPPERPVTCAVLLAFKAKVGHEMDVAQFLREARQYVEEEPGTTAWFALRWVDKPHFGIFDVFPDHSARNSHLTGRVPRELTKHALKLVGGMPSMKMADVLATHMVHGAVEAGVGAA